MSTAGEARFELDADADRLARDEADRSLVILGGLPRALSRRGEGRGEGSADMRRVDRGTPGSMKRYVVNHSQAKEWQYSQR